MFSADFDKSVWRSARVKERINTAFVQYSDPCGDWPLKDVTYHFWNDKSWKRLIHCCVQVFACCIMSLWWHIYVKHVSILFVWFFYASVSVSVVFCLSQFVSTFVLSAYSNFPFLHLCLFIVPSACVYVSWSICVVFVSVFPSNFWSSVSLYILTYLTSSCPPVWVLLCLVSVFTSFCFLPVRSLD